MAARRGRAGHFGALTGPGPRSSDRGLSPGCSWLSQRQRLGIREPRHAQAAEQAACRIHPVPAAAQQRQRAGRGQERVGDPQGSWARPHSPPLRRGGRPVRAGGPLARAQLPPALPVPRRAAGRQGPHPAPLSRPQPGHPLPEAEVASAGRAASQAGGDLRRSRRHRPCAERRRGRGGHAPGERPADGRDPQRAKHLIAEHGDVPLGPTPVRTGTPCGFMDESLRTGTGPSDRVRLSPTTPQGQQPLLCLTGGIPAPHINTTTNPHSQIRIQPALIHRSGSFLDWKTLGGIIPRSLNGVPGTGRKGMCDADFSLRPEITRWVILQASRNSRHARPRDTLAFSIYGLGKSFAE